MVKLLGVMTYGAAAFVTVVSLGWFVMETANLARIWKDRTEKKENAIGAIKAWIIVVAIACFLITGNVIFLFM